MSIKQLEPIYAALRARPHFTRPVEERRAGVEKVTSRFPVPGDVQLLPVDCAGIPGLWVVPPAVSDDRVVLHIHGGGFATGSPNSHSELASRIGRSARARVLLIDYRLFPENPFPAGLEDCITSYAWLLESGYNPRHIAVLGDSAGATLIFSTLLDVKEKGLALPACLVSLSGWFDLTNSSASIETHGDRDVFVPLGFNDWTVRHYLGNHDPRDPRASPIYGSCRGFPPVLLHIGSEDRLLDDANRMHAKLRDDGVSSTLEVWPDMPHVWHVFGQILDEGREATERAGRFILEHTAGAG